VLAGAAAGPEALAAMRVPAVVGQKFPRERAARRTAIEAR
jgi:hypothetical protein